MRNFAPLLAPVTTTEGRPVRQQTTPKRETVSPRLEPGYALALIGLAVVLLAIGGVTL